MAQHKSARDRRRYLNLSHAVSREILDTLAPVRDTLVSEFQEQMKIANGSYVTIPIWTFAHRVWNTPAPWTLPADEREEATRQRTEAADRIEDNDYESVTEHYFSFLGDDYPVTRVSITELVRRSDLLDRLAEAFGPNFRLSWEWNEVVHDEDQFTIYEARILLHYYRRGRPAWYVERLAQTPLLPADEGRALEMQVRGMWGRYIPTPPAPVTPPLRARPTVLPPAVIRASLRSNAPEDIEPCTLFTDKNCISRT